MSSESTTERILVPLEILEGEMFDDDLIDLLSTAHVVVLGYHHVPEQTAPSQMRQQYEERAITVLDDIVTDFKDAGGTAERRLIFTHEPEQSINRVIEEIAATARVYPNHVRPVSSMLLVLDRPADPVRLATFAATLRGDRAMEVTVVVPRTPRSTVDATEKIEVCTRTLREHDVPPEAIEGHIKKGTSIVEAVADVAATHDITIMGKHERDWRNLFFGEVSERVATESLGPVFEVFRETDREPNES